MATPARVGLCLDCNYALQGLLSTRCPECGRGFDPNDAASFNPGRPVPGYAAWAAGPISGPVEAVAAVGVAVMLWRARLPGISFPSRSPQMIGWAILAGVWLAWPLLRRGVLRHYGWPAKVIRPMGRRYAVVPLIMLAMVAVTVRGLPRRWAFVASRPAFDPLAAQVIHRPHVKVENRRVGLFWAKKIVVVPGGMRFTVEDDNVQFKAGFVYLPRLDPAQKTLRYRYLGGGWWSWREDG